MVEEETGLHIYIKHASMILALRKIWQSELAVKPVLIFAVGGKGMWQV